MTLIINSETGKKLSKRDESVLQFIEQYRDLGYLPEAMFNFITLLGWSPRVKTKSLTSVNSSSNLTLHVCLSHLLLLTKET